LDFHILTFFVLMPTLTSIRRLITLFFAYIDQFLPYIAEEKNYRNEVKHIENHGLYLEIKPVYIQENNKHTHVKGINYKIEVECL